MDGTAIYFPLVVIFFTVTVSYLVADTNWRYYIELPETH